MPRYVPGLPNFNMGVFGSVSEDLIPGMDVHLSIPVSNLIFRRLPESATFGATFEIHLEVTNVDSSNTPVYARSFFGEVQKDTYKQTQGLDEYDFKRRVILPPGKYKVKATVFDDHSRKSLNRLVVSEIPSLGKGQISASSIQLLGLRTRLDSTDFKPLLTYHIPSIYDSLKANIQLTLQKNVENMNLRMRLLRFESDTLPAVFPHYRQPQPGQLSYKGIDFEKADTLQVSRRNFDGLYGAITVDFELPKLRRGVYRVEIEALENDSLLVFAKGRDFNVREQAFPRLTTLEEMAEATFYVNELKPYAKMVTERNPDSLKRQFDSFWTRFTRNKYVAKGTIATYYSRVEEANMMFSTYKEGWKTDPGMVYVLFGPPSSVEEDLNSMIWYYPYSYQDIPNVFIFERARVSHRHFPFTIYIMQRGFQYERNYYLALDEWSGGFNR